MKTKVDKYNVSMLMKYGRNWMNSFPNTTTSPLDAGLPTQHPLFNDSIQDGGITQSVNSFEVFETKIKPNLTARQSLVFNAVAKIEPCTMHDTAKFLHVELNTISGRFGELEKKGYLKVIGKNKQDRSLYRVAHNE